MSFLSQAPLLDYLPSSHGAFQGHAAYIMRRPMMLSPKGSLDTCISIGVSTFLHAAFTAHFASASRPRPRPSRTTYRCRWLLQRLHRCLSPRRLLPPHRPRHARHPGRLHSSCACSRDRRGGVTGATSLPPSPLGAVRIAGAPGGPGRLRPPAGASGWLLRRPGLPPEAGESPRNGARGCSS